MAVMIHLVIEHVRLARYGASAARRAVRTRTIPGPTRIGLASRTHAPVIEHVDERDEQLVAEPFGTAHGENPRMDEPYRPSQLPHPASGDGQLVGGRVAGRRLGAERGADGGVPISYVDGERRPLQHLQLFL